MGHKFETFYLLVSILISKSGAQGKMYDLIWIWQLLEHTVFQALELSKVYTCAHAHTHTVYRNKTAQLSSVQKTDTEAAVLELEWEGRFLITVWVWSYHPGEVWGERGRGGRLCQMLQKTVKCWEVKQGKYRKLTIAFDHRKEQSHWGWEQNGAN